MLALAGGPALAEDKASAADAKAMLERAVAAVKADEPKALAAFSQGADGFKDRDLYVFCAPNDGKVDAHVDPAQIGRNIKDSMYERRRGRVRPGNDGDRDTGDEDHRGQLYVAGAWPHRTMPQTAKNIGFVTMGGRSNVRRWLLQVKV